MRLGELPCAAVVLHSPPQREMFTRRNQAKAAKEADYIATQKEFVEEK